MTKVIAAVLAAVLMLGSAGQADAKKNHTGRNIAIGVGAALATGIILNEAAKAEDTAAATSRTMGTTAPAGAGGASVTTRVSGGHAASTTITAEAPAGESFPP